MIFFANELSFHEQFESAGKFREAFSRLLAMRISANRRGFEVYCSKKLLSAMPVTGMTVMTAIYGHSNDESCRFSNDQIRSAKSWLIHGGPFYEDFRCHSGNDYLECCNELVTDSTVAEAAYRSLNGLESCLFSAIPSDWNYGPVVVKWRREAEGLDDKVVELSNWRDVNLLEAALGKLELPIRSWNDLKVRSTRSFDRLVFSNDCFNPLFDGIPFEHCVAERFFILLGILNQIAMAFDEDGRWNSEGHRIYRDYFTGSNALFSDSSESEKHEFNDELTFSHPSDAGKTLCCSWHGKVRHSVMRLHFSWPIRKDEPVYVVYAGPKITKK